MTGFTAVQPFRWEGPEPAKKMMEAAYKRWPDLKVAIEDLLAEEDKVVVRNSWTGSEAATGEKIEFHGFVMWRFANKKIVERWATITPATPSEELRDGMTSWRNQRNSHGGWTIAD